MKRRLLLVAAFLAVFAGGVVALLTGTDNRGPISRPTLDGWYYHSYLASLFSDGDLDFTDEYQYTHNWEHYLHTPVKRPGNPFPIGSPLLSAPFYLLGTAIEQPAQNDGFGDWQIRMTMLASPFFTALAIFFAYRLVRRRLGSEIIAAAAPLLIALAGPWLFYAVRQPGYAHPAAAFMVAWLLDFWDASYDRPRRLAHYAAMGALVGVAALVRPQLVTWALVVAAAALDDFRRERSPRVVARLAAAAAAAVLAFTPQLLAWKAIYGKALLLPQGPGFMVWAKPMLVDILYATRDGLFSWAPITFFAVVGLLVALRRERRLAGVLLLGFLLQLYVNAAAWDWWGGPGMAGRRFDSCLTAFAFGLATLLALALRRRLVPRFLAVLTAALSIFLAWGNAVFTMHMHIWHLMHLGSKSVTELIDENIDTGFAIGIGTVSWIVSFPARAAFALRYGVDLDRYDRIVGENFVGEVYPGAGGWRLSGEWVKLIDRYDFLDGFKCSFRGCELQGERGRILIPLNRRHGPIKVRFDPPVKFELTWDGKPIKGNALDPIERGVHELGLKGNPGDLIYLLNLDARKDFPP